MVEGLVGVGLAVAAIQILVVVGSLVGVIYIVDQLDIIRHRLQCIIQSLHAMVQEIEGRRLILPEGSTGDWNWDFRTGVLLGAVPDLTGR